MLCCSAKLNNRAFWYIWTSNKDRLLLHCKSTLFYEETIGDMLPFKTRNSPCIALVHSDMCKSNSLTWSRCNIILYHYFYGFL